MFYVGILVFYKPLSHAVVVAYIWGKISLENLRSMNIGRNVAKLRVYKGIKQADMAKRLKMTQQNYSLSENSESISDEVLDKIAAVLEFNSEFIRDLPELPNLFSNNLQVGNLAGTQFNPIDKIIELYERLLQSEREKIELLKSKAN